MSKINKLWAYVILSAAVILTLSACGGDPDAALDRQYKAKPEAGNIMEVVESNQELSTLSSVLESTGLDDVLADESQLFTLFAPTNSAFDAVGEKALNDLLKNEQALKSVLLYHVIVNAEVNAYQALKMAGQTAVSGNGTLVSINRWDKKVFINGVEVVIIDQKASNGVVHVIDTVLLPPDVSRRSVDDVKADILSLATSYSGMADSEFALQRTFEPLLAELLTLAPQAPVAKRIALVSQPWKQIWGPYNYGSGQEGVDPDISVDEVYQVVFQEGYYYNVTPLIDKNTGIEQIGMLRGEFSFDSTDDRCLKVQFVRFPGVSRRPEALDLWKLPAIEEAGNITSQLGLSVIEIVPSWIVRSFFGGGQLCEIYTDESLRISISTEDDNPSYRNLYILTRIDG